ncbi:hypothetical protein CBER1_07891 [Cercospora berteroae]|uniref:Major facilitator superfamily (MFS) profile domain-containing protein n=1 Tax=Cercospora berteroae TaxID=357750 RepID=A0A2S6BUE3_9PEZI|nr:hypothetical protein CBER1_07891 [Cercospora berteroae]
MDYEMNSDTKGLTTGIIREAEVDQLNLRLDVLLNPDDEAAKILINYSAANPHLTGWTEDEENKLKRKVDFQLMPILCLIYGMHYYDKAMISQAALFGLQEDLGLNRGTRFSMASAIFYLGFMAGAYPAMFLAQKYPLERVAAAIVVLWGACVLTTPACVSHKGLYTQRFFLGFLEAGVSPMWMMLCGSWYKKNEQALRIGIWYSTTGYVSIFSPLINYGLGHIEGSLSNWTYMYFFAGACTIVLGIATWFVLQPDPIRATFFCDRERYILIARMRTNNSGIRNQSWKKDQVIELLCDLKFWLVFFMAAFGMVNNGAVSTFMPVVISGWGYSSLTSLLLIMPAAAYAGTLIVLSTYCAMKFDHVRTWLIVAAQCMTTLSAILLWQLPRDAQGGLLFALYILPSTSATYAILMGLQIANTAGYTKRALASSGIYIGYCLGNFVGPLVFLDHEKPKYSTGFIITFVTAAATGVMGVIYRLICQHDNRKRDREGVHEGFDHAFEDPTDKVNKQFRYII